MAGFLIRMLITSLGLWVASAIVPGLEIQGFGTLLGSAILLGLVNAVVRPVIILLTLPITIVTLGVFLLVINAAMLGLVASLLKSFAIQGFFSALLGSVIVSLVSWFASWFIGPRGRYEILVVRR
jgi:putative membrane protein